MSRIGKKEIKLPGKVAVSITGSTVEVKGPKGTLGYTLPEGISLEQENGALAVVPADKRPATLRFQGLARSIIQNLVKGVSDGFVKELEIQGIGYCGQVNGGKLALNLGYSHPVEFEIPADIKISMPDNTHILVQGIDKQRVGQVAATIRDFRPPDSYKGKGVRYKGEEVVLKEGKTLG